MLREMKAAEDLQHIEEIAVLQASLRRAGAEYTREELSGGLRRARALRWFDQLPQEDRLILVLSRAEELSGEEIAEVLGLWALEVERRLAGLIEDLRAAFQSESAGR